MKEYQLPDEQDVIAQLPLFLRTVRQFYFPHKLGLLDRIYGSSLKQKGVSWQEVYTGHDWLLDLRNPCHRWMVYGDYADSNFLKWARRHVPKNGTIVDSGSNIGQFLPYFSEIVTQGRILAFEPSAQCSAWVRMCLARNPNMPVDLIQKGLGKGQKTLYLKQNGPEEARGLWGEITQDEGEEVEITPLAKELERRGISEVDLWKLDVEGYEVPALEGANHLLQQQRIKALYIELSPKEDNNRKILDFMSGVGYDCFLFEADSLQRHNKPLDRERCGLFLPSS